MYKIGESASAQFFRAAPIAPLDYLAILRGEVSPRGVIPFAWESGSATPGDIVWTGTVFAILLSRQARSALRGLAGWKSHPVSLRGADGRQIADYHLLTVQGRCGPIVFAKSAVVERRYPGGTFPEYRGLFFDQHSWDQSGIFMPANRVGFIFISEAARIEFEKLKDANLQIERLDEVQLDEMTKVLLEAAKPC